MQAGEKRFARRLGSHLEGDYLCWYETGVGLRPKYTDFVVLHPLRGILLLEVKDWKLETIKSANPEVFELFLSSGPKSVLNPFKQARLCAYKIKDQLEGDRQLIHAKGKYRGKLILPYGYGVVLTRITRRQFERSGLGEVIPETQVICSDEMQETVEIEDFQKRLWDMFEFNFNRPLTQPQIDRIRWHMFPEIRMQPQPELSLPNEQEESVFDIPDIVKVMDLRQEKLARGLGAGHRVIHGVAGSGKTMILGYRCLHLAKLMNKPVLVLCYNVALAARLRALIAQHGIDDRINVYSIHRWANTMLKTYNFSLPPNLSKNFDAAIELLTERVEKGDIPRGQYGAVLIDEGHDFKKEWLRLVVDMVDPDTKSLLLLYDDAQSIYKQTNGLGFTLKDVGIEAQGRTTVLKLNYRNTEEILKFAFDFIDDYVQPDDGDEERLSIVKPDACGRKGKQPAIRSFKSFNEEAAYIASMFRKLHSQREIAWSEMGVLYCHKWMGKALADEFKKMDIPTTWLKDTAAKRELDIGEESVKLLTMHSSKGLEFRTVATCGIGSLGMKADRIQEDAKLLYVAMTRATESLLLTCSKESPFVSKLQKMADRYSKGEAA